MKNPLVPLALAMLIASSANGQLRITEVESTQAGGEHSDWWEVTNFGLTPVDLVGYKFDDSSGSIATSVTLTTSSLSLAPGQSVIFVESMTPEEFRTWWGTGLSAGAQIVTYTGSGVGFGASGDAVHLWDSTDVLVDQVTFGQATAGVSFGYDGGIFGALSQAGVGGAFVAFENGDVGSPGIAVVPEPSTTALLLTGLLALAYRFRRGRRQE